MKLKFTENKSKFELQSYKFENTKDEFMFFGPKTTFIKNFDKYEHVKISDKYYSFSGNQNDWSTCNLLDEFDSQIFTVDQDKDKSVPEINTIGKNNSKFFINCSLMNISDFIDKIFAFQKKDSNQASKDKRLVSKFKLLDDKLLFIISTISKISKFNENFEEIDEKEKTLQLKAINGTYVVSTFYFNDIFNDTEPSGFETLGHLIELEN